MPVYITQGRYTREAIKGMIVKPEGFDPSKKYPLFVLIHGGAHTMWQDAIKGQEVDGPSHFKEADVFRSKTIRLSIALRSFKNIAIEGIAGNTDRLVANNTCQRYHGNTRGTATYIDDHVTYRLFHVNTDTYSSRHWLMNKINFFRTGVFRGIPDRALFDFGHAGRNPNDHPRSRTRATRRHHSRRACCGASRRSCRCASGRDG